MRIHNFTLRFLILLCAAIVGFSAWFFFNVTSKSPLHDTVLTGIVEPVILHKVTPLVPGTLRYVHVTEGEDVIAGNVIAELDDQIAKAQLEEYQTLLTRLQQETEPNTDRIATTNDLINAQHTLLSQLQMRSPIDGKILKQFIAKDMPVTIGEDIFWIGHADPRHIVVETSPDYDIKTGTEVEMTSETINDTHLIQGRVVARNAFHDKVILHIAFDDTQTPLPIGSRVAVRYR